VVLKFKKFFAFEWLMLLVIGFFWAAAMALPLYLSQSFDNKADLPENILIMTGPYLVYLCVRSLWLLGRSVVWAYLTSNFFFISLKEKAFAEEWMRFVFFGLLWMMCISVPMYLTGMFTDEGGLFTDALFLLAPYMCYLLAKGILAFLKSIGWAVVEVSKEAPIKQNNKRK
jgi:hypothetical protein